MTLRIPRPIFRLYYEIAILLQKLFQEFVTLKDKLSLRLRGVTSESVEILLAVRIYMPQILKSIVGLQILESIINAFELPLREALQSLEQIRVKLRSIVFESLLLETWSKVAYGVQRLVNLITSDQISQSLSAVLREISRCLEQLIGSLRGSISEVVSLSVLLRYYFTVVGSCLLTLSESIVRRFSSSLLEFLRTQEQLFGSLRCFISEILTLGPRCFIQCLQRILVNLVLTEVISRRLSSLQFEGCRTPDQSSGSLRRRVVETLSLLVRCSFWIRILVRSNLVISESIVYTQPQPPIFDVAIFDQAVFW